MRIRLVGLVLGLAVLVALTPSAQSNDARVLLEAARKIEMVDGNLPAAIAKYQEIVDKFGKANPAATVESMIRMADCYEKLGDRRAQDVRDNAIRQYPEEAAQLGVKTAPATTGSATGDRLLASGDNVPEPAYTSISPDGTFLAYSDNDTGVLVLRDVKTGKDRPLPSSLTSGTSGEWAFESAVSRDGSQVAYKVSTGKRGNELRLLSTNRPEAGFRTLLARADGQSVYPRAWSADGKQIAVEISPGDRTTQLALLNVETGAMRVLKSLGWRGSSMLALSPDGRFLAFDTPADDSTVQRDVYVLATDGSRQTSVIEGPSRDSVVGWSPDGRRLLFLSDRRGPMSLWGQPMVDGNPAGEPVLIQADHRGTPLGVTTTGAVCYFVVTRDQSLQVASVDLDTGRRLAGPSFPALDLWASNRQPKWSSDGASLAYISSRPRATTDRTLTIQSLKTNTVREVPLRLGYTYTYDWSPDGRWFVARATDFKGRQGIFLVDAESGEEKPIVLNTPGAGYFHPEFSRDGKKIYYVKGDEAANKGVAAQPSQSYVERDVASGEERVLFRHRDLKTPEGAPFPRARKEGISPDGRFVAAFTLAPESTLFVIDVQAGTARRVFHREWQFAFSRNGGVQWTHDSRGLVLNVSANSRRDGRELWFIPLNGDPRRLDIGSASLIESAVALHPDGNRIAFIAGEPVAIEVRLFQPPSTKGSSAKR